VEGDCTCYIGQQTPMSIYGNAHCLLQKLRQDALSSKSVGPKVLIVGSTDSGKTSLCKLLSNYAVRMGEKPTYVDLDIGQGCITVPGMIAAIPIERPIDPTDGFDTVNISQPMVQFYGDLSPKNSRLYIEQIKSLLKAVFARFEQTPEAAASGIICNTCGWVDAEGYDLLLKIIDAFIPTVIFVIGHEKLYSGLCKDVSEEKEVKIVKLPKSGGVVTRDPMWRKINRYNRIKEYFYGVGHSLCPREIVLPFDAIGLYRITKSVPAPSSSLLPLGAETTINKLEAIKVVPSFDLHHLLIGISYAKKGRGIT